MTSKSKAEPFRFKQFDIMQDRCPMKVGTDGILLGAWANVDGVGSVLDIGAGTGLIAIMLAQRTGKAVQVDAVEIDEVSCRQALDNMDKAPWSSRLHCERCSVQEYAKFADRKYDLIVSNPPFFTGGTFSHNQDRNSVRHTIKLPHGDLLTAARKLLTDQGRLAVILPYIEGLRFQEMALTYNLYCRRITEVLPRAEKNIERLLMEFELNPGEIQKDELVIREAGENNWSAPYVALTSPFYLFMD